MDVYRGVEESGGNWHREGEAVRAERESGEGRVIERAGKRRARYNGVTLVQQPVGSVGGLDNLRRSCCNGIDAKERGEIAASFYVTGTDGWDKLRR